MSGAEISGVVGLEGNDLTPAGGGSIHGRASRLSTGSPPALLLFGQWLYVARGGDPIEIRNDHPVLDLRVRPPSSLARDLDGSQVVPTEFPLDPGTRVRQIITRSRLPERLLPPHVALAEEMRLHEIGVFLQFRGRGFVLPAESLAWCRLDTPGERGTHFLIPLARLRAIQP